MLPALHAAAVVMTAVVMAPALAHALEIPGKRRLDLATYRVVQQIYYPGFTLIGALEIPTLALVIGSAAATSSNSSAFLLRCAGALGCLVLVLTYWLWVHPINREWLRDTGVTSAGADRFFGLQRSTQPGGTVEADTLRDRWERGHLARAAAVALSLVAQVLAMA
jgi:hypothetical protein